MSRWRVRLEPYQIAYADENARAKHLNAVTGQFTPGNNAPSNPDWALAKHILGSRCEYAAKLCYSPVVWHEFGIGQPDLDDFIDVKGIDQPGLSLCVPINKVRPSWAYLLVESEHPWYTMRGWSWGANLLRQKLIKDPKGGRPAHFMHPTDLLFHGPDELLDILRYRQRKREQVA